MSMNSSICAKGEVKKNKVLNQFGTVTPDGVALVVKFHSQLETESFALVEC